MKKLVFVVALALGSLTAFAQETETEDMKEMKDDATEVVAEQDDFAAIELSELPETIAVALERDYPGATVAEAFVNEDSQYKLKVTQEDGTELKLYADAEGNWLEM